MTCHPQGLLYLIPVSIRFQITYTPPDSRIYRNFTFQPWAHMSLYLWTREETLVYPKSSPCILCLWPIFGSVISICSPSVFVDALHCNPQPETPPVPTMISVPVTSDRVLPEFRCLLQHAVPHRDQPQFPQTFILAPGLVSFLRLSNNPGENVLL